MRAGLAKWLGRAALAGLGLVALNRAALGTHLGRPVARAPRRLGISILKPLCGIDDGLADNLEAFARLDYAPYELLLGCESEQDPAWDLAQAFSTQYPHVRAVLQDGSPGLNPKVNQLATLARNAQYGVLLISDSGVRPPRGYLDEMSAMFTDPAVGLATNPITGTGHASLGALFDNMHAASNSALHAGGKALLGRAFVMGGSEAIRRDVLESLGGFEAYANVLAEDYLLGRDVERLGYKVATGRLPVQNVAPNRTVESFYRRFARWGQMQSTAEGPLPALGMALLNPIPLAAIAAVLAPAGQATSVALRTLAGITAAKVALDLSTARALGVAPLGLGAALAVPMKDAVLFGSWLSGLTSRSVDWRGKKFRLGAGTKLTRDGHADDSASASGGSHLGLAHRPRQGDGRRSRTARARAGHSRR